jgi:3-hydroxyisobutyrate dehydrogenase-like beta-hydroxyacid dehydrogenase
MSAVATGARNGVTMPATTGALASFSAAVAGGWGERDLAEVPRYFREFMLQAYE